MFKLIRKLFSQKTTAEQQMTQYHNQLAAATLARIALKGK